MAAHPHRALISLNPWVLLQEIDASLTARARARAKNGKVHLTQVRRARAPCAAWQRFSPFQHSGPLRRQARIISWERLCGVPANRCIIEETYICNRTNPLGPVLKGE